MNACRRHIGSISISISIVSTPRVHHSERPTSHASHASHATTFDLGRDTATPRHHDTTRTQVPDGTATTVYRCGDLIDLCRGPHVAHSGKISSFKVWRSSATNWLGKVDNDTLQRVYGVSFPDKKMLAEWVENMKKAEERNHRNVGPHQELFMFHDLSPGSCFFMPRGTRIYNRLVDFIKQQYWLRGYDEVTSRHSLAVSQSHSFISPGNESLTVSQFHLASSPPRSLPCATMCSLPPSLLRMSPTPP